jgi:PAS domain S-box-containing protein
MLTLRKRPERRVRRPTHTGREVHFDHDDLIVSKTDTKGRITYANRTFVEVSGYSERELLGQPHSLIRHPDMPRAVFKLLWDHLLEDREVFAYVKNLAKSGDHYWVFAHVTPSTDARGTVVGFHSNRRVPDRDTLDDSIIPLYSQLLQMERASANRHEGLDRSHRHLIEVVEGRGMEYGEFIFSI